MAKLLFLEPYFTGSHAAWLRGYQSHSSHHIDRLTMPGQYWQWRMLGGAVTLAREFMAAALHPDAIIASDMLDLTTFLALTRARTSHLPIYIYFHENQMTYPPGPRVPRKKEQGFINYASALAADRVFFNSEYHRWAFLDELPRLLKHYPDHNELATIDLIRHKSLVLPVGVDLHRLDQYYLPKRNTVPLILWNHRWEHDKNPTHFFNALYRLQMENIPFEVVLLGENVRREPAEFIEARERLGARILHYGYAPDLATYARWLWQADVVVSAAYQDFFGISMVEAIYCGCYPLLPRRLNYPALIPARFHAEMLYLDGELYQVLKKYLRQRPVTPPELASYVGIYDWRQIAPLYDFYMLSGN